MVLPLLGRAVFGLLRSPVGRKVAATVGAGVGLAVGEKQFEKAKAEGTMTALGRTQQTTRQLGRIIAAPLTSATVKDEVAELRRLQAHNRANPLPRKELHELSPVERATTVAEVVTVGTLGLASGAAGAVARDVQRATTDLVTAPPPPLAPPARRFGGLDRVDRGALVHNDPPAPPREATVRQLDKPAQTSRPPLTYAPQGDSKMKLSDLVTDLRQKAKEKGALLVPTVTAAIPTLSTPADEVVSNITPGRAITAAGLLGLGVAGGVAAGRAVARRRSSRRASSKGSQKRASSKGSRKRSSSRKASKSGRRSRGSRKRASSRGKGRHWLAREDRSGVVRAHKTWGGKKVKFTKRGQPYVIMADGKARFVSK